ncbi:uncharacterized protein LOC143292206 [Babylonia areolata]|uniref:uncharacterized protein LOC143292206 n=1 Tax=Babylonia areolata TaxID=304850 RepID=UPI003FD533F8
MAEVLEIKLRTDVGFSCLAWQHRWQLEPSNDGVVSVRNVSSGVFSRNRVLTNAALVHVQTSSGNDVSKRFDDPPALSALVTQQGQLLEEQRAQIHTLKNNLIKMNDELERFKDQVATSQKMVCFMVSASRNDDLRHHPRIQFGEPDLNVGNGFDTNTDIFVTPITGVYVLFLKVAAISGGITNFGIFSVKKEGQEIAETETNDDDNYDRASVQVIVQLKEGERVWVEKTLGGAYTMFNGGVYSTFGGFLLRAGLW